MRPDRAQQKMSYSAIFAVFAKMSVGCARGLSANIANFAPKCVCIVSSLALRSGSLAAVPLPKASTCRGAGQRVWSKPCFRFAQTACSARPGGVTAANAWSGCAYVAPEAYGGKP